MGKTIGIPAAACLLMAVSCGQTRHADAAMHSTETFKNTI